MIGINSSNIDAIMFSKSILIIKVKRPRTGNVKNNKECVFNSHTN